MDLSYILKLSGIRDENVVHLIHLASNTNILSKSNNTREIWSLLE